MNALLFPFGAILSFSGRREEEVGPYVACVDREKKVLYYSLSPVPTFTRAFPVGVL